MVVNEDLEKTRAYLGPQDRWLNVHPKDTKVTLLLKIWVRAECALKRKNPCCQRGQNLGPEPGTTMSTVQCFGTKYSITLSHVIR